MIMISKSVPKIAFNESYVSFFLLYMSLLFFVESFDLLFITLVLLTEVWAQNLNSQFSHLSHML